MTGAYGEWMAEWLQQPVRLHGVQLGTVVDVILDNDGESPVGLEVRCEDGQHRFVPVAAATLMQGGVVVDSPFALLDGDQLRFYKEHGVALRGRGRPAA